MAASRHRTRSLHNFDLPELRWGNQRLLHCVKLPSSASDHRRKSSDSSDDIDAVREKLMLDLRAAANQMKLSMLPEKDAGNLKSPPPPWNLRTRKSAYKAPAVDSGGSPPKSAERLSQSKAATPVKFSVALKKAEIGEDFRAMAGMRPPRRPKKRPRTVQEELDRLFPGLRLTEVTQEAYKVDDVAE